MKAIFDRHAPQIVKRVKGKPCPWMISDIRKMMTSRDRMLRKARRTKKEEHWNLYKKLRNQCNNKMKYAKSSFHKETLEENSTKPRRFWNTIKNVFPTKPKQMTTNLYRANDPNRPTMFSTYFASVVRMLKNKAIPLVDFVWRQPVALLSRTDKVFKITVISRAFIVNELKHFKRNKATGVDELPSGMLKDVREYISYPLCYILNLSVTTATVPITWKCAKIIPVHKSGSYDQPENFRPISVLPILSKLLEKAVHKQYLTFLQEEK